MEAKTSPAPTSSKYSLTNSHGMLIERGHDFNRARFIASNHDLIVWPVESVGQLAGACPTSLEWEREYR